MKKLSIILVQFFFVTGAAFAATPIAPGGKVLVPAGQSEAGTIIAAMSTRVMGSILSSEYSFAVVLKHLFGSREYATSSASTKNFYNFVAPEDKDTPNMGLKLNNSTSEDFNFWITL
jgi:hypothetical protein